MHENHVNIIRAGSKLSQSGVRTNDVISLSKKTTTMGMLENEKWLGEDCFWFFS